MLPLIVLPDLPAEDALLAHARQGDDEALRDIYGAYFSPIYQYIRLRVDSTQQAEDLSSEVFLKLITACRGKNAPKHSLRGWLFRVARNVIHDHYGKSKQFTETVLGDWIPADTDDDPEVQFMRGLNREQARQAIRRLSFAQQEVIILRFGHLLSLQETAEIMGKKANAIKALQFRALNKLREILQSMGAELHS